MSNFDSILKSMGSYKVDQLTDLCKKLNINIEANENKKKITKKDIYELLVLHY
jgi:tRNA A37 threonylcarbamoyladenosine dehydratase